MIFRNEGETYNVNNGYTLFVRIYEDKKIKAQNPSNLRII